MLESLSPLSSRRIIGTCTAKAFLNLVPSKYEVSVADKTFKARALILNLLFSVLPPVPTTGLAVSDVGSLATRVRDQMMEALRDISRKPPAESEEEKSHAEPKKSSLSASSEAAEPLEPAASLLESASIAIEPSSVDGILQSKGSSSSIASSSVSAAASVSTSDRRRPSLSEAGTETEEDEGMVLVGRPH